MEIIFFCGIKWPLFFQYTLPCLFIYQTTALPPSHHGRITIKFLSFMLIFFSKHISSVLQTGPDLLLWIPVGNKVEAFFGFFGKKEKTTAEGTWSGSSGSIRTSVWGGSPLLAPGLKATQYLYLILFSFLPRVGRHCSIDRTTLTKIRHP